jgi:hypothetical protein
MFDDDFPTRARAASRASAPHGGPPIPDPHVRIPAAAHRFTLLVSAMVWVGMIAFGAYVCGTATAGHRERLLAGAALIAGGTALVSATYQEWRRGIRLNANPRAALGVACLALAALAIALLR